MNETRMVVHAGWQLNVTVTRQKNGIDPTTFWIFQQTIRHASVAFTPLSLKVIEDAPYTTADRAFEVSFRALRKRVDRLVSRGNSRHAP
jgi:hypothetical protein